MEAIIEAVQERKGSYGRGEAFGKENQGVLLIGLRMDGTASHCISSYLLAKTFQYIRFDCKALAKEDSEIISKIQSLTSQEQFQ